MTDKNKRKKEREKKRTKKKREREERKDMNRMGGLGGNLPFSPFQTKKSIRGRSSYRPLSISFLIYLQHVKK